MELVHGLHEAETLKSGASVRLGYNRNHLSCSGAVTERWHSRWEKDQLFKVLIVSANTLMEGQSERHQRE